MSDRGVRLFLFAVTTYFITKDVSAVLIYSKRNEEGSYWSFMMRKGNGSRVDGDE